MTTILTTSVITISAYIAAALFGVMIVIQLLLATGVLPVTMAWGGKQEVLTPRLRIASVVSALVLGVFGYLILYRVGLTGVTDVPVWVKVVAWIVTAYMGLNTLGNLASQSRTEKIVFTPITVVLTVTCLLVSLS